MTNDARGADIQDELQQIARLGNLDRRLRELDPESTAARRAGVSIDTWQEWARDRVTEIALETREVLTQATTANEELQLARAESLTSSLAPYVGSTDPPLPAPEPLESGVGLQPIRVSRATLRLIGQAFANYQLESGFVSGPAGPRTFTRLFHGEEVLRLAGASVPVRLASEYVTSVAPESSFLLPQDEEPIDPVQLAVVPQLAAEFALLQAWLADVLAGDWIEENSPRWLRWLIKRCKLKLIASMLFDVNGIGDFPPTQAISEIVSAVRMAQDQVIRAPDLDAEELASACSAIAGGFLG